jgi:hypothetical protein
VDVVAIAYGKKFDQGKISNATHDGARQAMTVNADGRGYVQEIAIPWKLLTGDGKPLVPGDAMTITFEPNFTIRKTGRYTIKDNFRPGITPDRVFTFMASPTWGPATVLVKGKVDPQLVRLSDGRVFPVTVQNGQSAVDWTGLIKSTEPTGFKSITFTAPATGTCRSTSSMPTAPSCANCSTPRSTPRARTR